MSIVKKEKREEILYAKISKTNKKYLKKQAKAYGYTSVSEFVDNIIDNFRKKIS